MKPDEREACLNSHVRDMIKYHFDEDMGTPYWIRYAKEKGIDPLKEVQCFDDLNIFGLLNDEDLKTIPIEDFIPKAMLDYKKYRPAVYETGGTSGIPKRVMDAVHEEENAVWLSDLLIHHGFRRKGSWLNLFPSGPHAASLLTYTIARRREELFYTIDIDPRWVKYLIKKDKREMMDLYMQHLMEQTINILKSQEITYLFITPKLLENLILSYDLSKTGIKGIVCGGTQITPEFYRFVTTEALPEADFCSIYGNTLMGGSAISLPQQFMEPYAKPYSIHYYSQFPQMVIEVMDMDDNSRKAAYGEEGRVKITALYKDMFIPGLLERDTGIRLEPVELFPWDGVADVGYYRPMVSKIVEGVY